MAGRAGALLELTRPTNLVLGAATVPLGATMVLGDDWTSEVLTATVLFASSVVAFMAAGNAMNDLRDIEVDKVAHPHRPLPSGRVSRPAAAKFTAGLWVVSMVTMVLGTAVLAVFMPEAPMLAPVIIWVLAALLMLAYDHGPALKDRGLIGNVAISVLVGAVVLFGASGGGAWSHPVALAAATVAALVNLAREIVKDVHDLEGDEGHRSTLPMAVGAERARMIAYVFAMLGLVVLYLPYWRGPLLYPQILFQVPAILLIITTNGPLYKGHDALVVGRLRLGMMAGLFGFLISVMM